MQKIIISLSLTSILSIISLFVAYQAYHSSTQTEELYDKTMIQFEVIEEELKELNQEIDLSFINDENNEMKKEINEIYEKINELETKQEEISDFMRDILR